MKLFVIRKEGNRWMVYVSPGTIATIGFVAPFAYFEGAVQYVRFYMDQFAKAGLLGATKV